MPMLAERNYSSPKIREKQAEFFLESVAKSLHDPKPANVPQESWDKKINFTSALLMGASGREIAEVNGTNTNSVYTYAREVVSRLWWVHSEEFRASHPMAELFDIK